MKKQYVSPACAAVEIDQPLLYEASWGVGDEKNPITDYTGDPNNDDDNTFNSPYFYTGFGDE